MPRMLGAAAGSHTSSSAHRENREAQQKTTTRYRGLSRRKRGRKYTACKFIDDRTPMQDKNDDLSAAGLPLCSCNCCWLGRAVRVVASCVICMSCSLGLCGLKRETVAARGLAVAAHAPGVLGGCGHGRIQGARMELLFTRRRRPAPALEPAAVPAPQPAAGYSRAGVGAWPWGQLAGRSRGRGVGVPCLLLWLLCAVGCGRACRKHLGAGGACGANSSGFAAGTCGAAGGPAG